MLRFVIVPESLQTNTTFNMGFCMEVEDPPDPDITWDSCLKPSSNPDELDLSDCRLDEHQCPNGVLDIARCMGGAPVFMSSPYFYHSPDFLREDVSMEEPVPALHETQLDVEPNTGITVSVHKRIQVPTVTETQALDRWWLCS